MLVIFVICLPNEVLTHIAKFPTGTLKGINMESIKMKVLHFFFALFSDVALYGCWDALD